MKQPKDINRVRLEKEYQAIDFKKEFKELGADLFVRQSGPNDFEYVIDFEGREVFSMQHPNPSYKPNPDVNFYISKKLEDLQKELDTNSRFIPIDVKVQMDFLMFACKHTKVEYHHPFTSTERKMMIDMNNINVYNKEMTDFLNEANDNGQLMNVINNMSFLGQTFNKEEFNKEFKTKFEHDVNYHAILIDFKSDLSYKTHLVIREVQEKDDSISYVGAILTNKDGLHTFNTFKPIRTLDREILGDIVGKFENVADTYKAQKVLEYKEQSGPEPWEDGYSPEKIEVKRLSKLTA